MCCNLSDTTQVYIMAIPFDQVVLLAQARLWSRTIWSKHLGDGYALMRKIQYKLCNKTCKNIQRDFRCLSTLWISQTLLSLFNFIINPKDSVVILFHRQINTLCSPCCAAFSQEPSCAHLEPLLCSSQPLLCCIPREPSLCSHIVVLTGVPPP
jgi:hypothetical protein